MKFTTQIKPFAQTLGIAASAVPSKSTLAVLECVQLVSIGGLIGFTGTDLELSITALYPEKSKQDGVTFIDARLLQDIVKALPDGEFTFSLDSKENLATIQTEQGKYHIRVENIQNFPIPSTGFTPSGSFEIDAKELGRLLDYTLYCTSADELRPSMMGVYFELGKNKLTATDGHRMSSVDCPMKGEVSFVVPTKTLSKVVKTFTEGKITVEYDATEDSAKAIQFSQADRKIWSRLIDERYPNYEAVIPKECDKTLTVNRTAMLNSIKRVQLFANVNTRQIRFSLSHNKLEVLADNFDNGLSGKETLACGYDADPLTIGFNARFVEDTLSHMKCEKVTMRFSTPTRAAIVEGDAGVMGLVMPVRLNV